MKQWMVIAAMLGLLCAQRAAAAAEQLVFWSGFSGGQPKEALDRFVEEFNRTHTSLGQVIKLDLNYNQLEQKLLTAVAGNVPSGLVLFNRPNAAAFTLRGAFEPWDPYLEELNLNEQDFFEHCWREGIWDGKQYCIPMNTDVRVLFYNRRLMRQAGLDPDAPPQTWDELREMSRKLTVRKPNGRLAQTGFVPLGGGFGNTYFPLFAYQMGERLVDEQGRIRVNRPLARKAMQWVNDFVGDYGAQDLMLLQTGSGSDQLSLFLQEKVALYGDEGYLLSLIRRYKPDLDFGVAPLPWPAEGQRATWSGGFGFVLPRGQKLTPLGAEFVRYLCSPAVQLEYGKISDQIPALRAAARDPYFMNNPRWRIFVQELDYSRSLPVSPLSLKMFTDLIRGTEKMIYGQMSPGQALDWVQGEMDTEWAKLTAYKDRPVFPWERMVQAAAGLLGLVLAARGVWVVGRLRRTRLHRGEILWGYLLALPAIVGLFCLALGPMILSLMVSGCNYDVLNPPHWLGLENYRQLFAADPLFYKSLWNTLVYTVLAVPLGVVLSLGLAMLLNQPVWLRTFWRGVFYLPSIFPVVAGSFLWLWLFNGELGLINRLLGLVGIAPAPWLTHPLWAKPALVIMSLWGVGMSVIIFLAALQAVPSYLYEAARIDGASPRQRFLYVTLPMISPSIFFIIVIATIGSFQVFTQALLMTEGGPLDSTLFYVLYLFRQGFQYFHMGYAAAMAWVLFLLIGSLTALQFWLSRRLVNYDAA